MALSCMLVNLLHVSSVEENDRCKFIHFSFPFCMLFSVNFVIQCNNRKAVTHSRLRLGLTMIHQFANWGKPCQMDRRKFSIFQLFVAFLGINQFCRVGLRFVLVYNWNTKRLTESGFMEKLGIEPATPGLQDIGLSPTPRRL